MKYGAYLIFNGKAKKAVAFYKSALGAEVVAMKTFAELPENSAIEIPDKAKNLIANATLKVGSQEIMISDTLPGNRVAKGYNVALTVTDLKAKEAITLADRLKVDGDVIMDIQKTPWSKAYGQVVDQFGIMWQINANK